jgi:rSAM/selenodomain-associated transferase 1
MADSRFAPNVVIMVKAPIAGLVKTRLARSIGSAEAVRFYRTTMAGIVNRVGRDRRWRTFLAITPDVCVGATFWPKTISRICQGQGDLGHRLQGLFDLPVRGPMVIIGSDVPDIRAGHIAEAFALLSNRDAVFGPADDGGYWLVGLKRCPSVPRIFAGVRWSTEHALADTCANVKGEVGFTAKLADVDAERDWRRWRRRN